MPKPIPVLVAGDLCATLTVYMASSSPKLAWRTETRIRGPAGILV